MASSEDVIRSAVPGGIGKPLILALLALLASGALFGRGSKEGSATKGPVRVASHYSSLPSMPPIRLSDAEVDAVKFAARPMPVDRRDAFLQEVASELQRCGESGPRGRLQSLPRATASVFRSAGLGSWDDDEVRLN